MGEDIVFYDEPGRSKKYVKIVFIGILAFIAVYFPLFGNNLRYQIGGMLDTLFNFIGIICLALGGINITIGFLGLVAKKFYVGNVVIGALLLWIGCWLTGIVINIFGVIFGGSEVSNPGYH